ncbi:MAG TPA: DNA alkylation repair protein [Clostridiales bacterium]|nr:DNA alkylation repair protein [Clostridiales bacterium]
MVFPEEGAEASSVEEAEASSEEGAKASPEEGAVASSGKEMASPRKETMEEVLLQGMIIGGCKVPVEEKLQLAAAFIPKIDCWPVCDNFCGELKIADTDQERVWEFIQPYLKSDQEYGLRFGVVMLLHYLNPGYADLAFAHFDRIRHEGYYVKMAVAWVLSMYYVNLPELTMEYLKKNELDDFTYNKALQKIIESLRVDQETKARIKTMKRNKKSFLS